MIFRYSLSLSSLDTPSPNVSVSLEVANCQIQRHFGWWYAIGLALLMFPQLHVFLIVNCKTNCLHLKPTYCETQIQFHRRNRDANCKLHVRAYVYGHSDRIHNRTSVSRRKARLHTRQRLGSSSRPTRKTSRTASAYPCQTFRTGSND